MGLCGREWVQRGYSVGKTRAIRIKRAGERKPSGNYACSLHICNGYWCVISAASIETMSSLSLLRNEGCAAFVLKQDCV